MSNLRSDAREWVEEQRLPPGDLARVYILRLANQVDQVVEGSVKAHRMTLRRFQELNARRCPEAFDHELNAWSLAEWSNALAGEVGEACNITKKIKRKLEGIGGRWAARDPDVDVLLARLSDELGDVLAYAALLASAADLDLWTCAARKFDHISQEAGWNGPRMLEED